ncbi:MAG: 16S rRNA processing protein RimM [Bacteroidetes bacterium]|nr:16S rRNA processing protein RimM [Bacteroidota bacterium]
MEISECFLLGYVSKLFGYKGDVIFFIDADEPENYLEMESVFVKKNNKLIPFFIDRIQKHSKQNNLIVKFQDINSAEQAELLVGSELYLPLSFLPKLTGNKFYFHEVIGFKVSDKDKGIIGEIKDIIDVGSTPIFQVFAGHKEILLPIHDNFLVSVDKDSKTIFYKAPEGLIDMYLADDLYSKDE